MEELGDNLLTGAMLPSDEHVGVGGTNLADEFEHWLHGRRAGDELRHAFRAEQAVFELELASATQGVMQFRSKNPDERHEGVRSPRASE